MKANCENFKTFHHTIKFKNYILKQFADTVWLFVSDL